MEILICSAVGPGPLSLTTGVVVGPGRGPTGAVSCRCLFNQEMNSEADGSVQGQTSGNRAPPRSVGARACAIAFLRLALWVLRQAATPLPRSSKPLISAAPLGRPAALPPQAPANLPAQCWLSWTRAGPEGGEEASLRDPPG